MFGSRVTHSTKLIQHQHPMYWARLQKYGAKRHPTPCFQRLKALSRYHVEGDANINQKISLINA